MLAALFVARFVPETRGHSLEHIQTFWRVEVEVVERRQRRMW
ncbi:MAG: hypothetical protein ACLGI7_11690 [Gammaproteobacteria bacterium]